MDWRKSLRIRWRKLEPNERKQILVQLRDLNVRYETRKNEQSYRDAAEACSLLFQVGYPPRQAGSLLFWASRSELSVRLGVRDIYCHLTEVERGLA